MSAPTRILTLGVLVWLSACGDGGAAGDPGPDPDLDVGAADSATAGRYAALHDAEPAGHLYVWAGDADRADPDFLAVLDADPESPAYGRAIASVPAGRSRTWPHHTEHRMPESRHLFANGFMTGETFRFDLTAPGAPRLLGSFAAAAGLTYPHSYERLPNGNVLATFQGHGERNVDPGGLVELTDAGEVVRSGSAADPAAPGALLRPYSLAIVPDLDRVVVTSYDMGEDMGFRGG
ncbi:MAG: selenium-binding family protein, partial [Chloroflexi bacterium]|nr:selenium-binding family protein [Chloroflexota bacterium]